MHFLHITNTIRRLTSSGFPKRTTHMCLSYKGTGGSRSADGHGAPEITISKRFQSQAIRSLLRQSRLTSTWGQWDSTSDGRLRPREAGHKSRGGRAHARGADGAQWPRFLVQRLAAARCYLVSPIRSGRRRRVTSAGRCPFPQSLQQRKDLPCMVQ